MNLTFFTTLPAIARVSCFFLAWVLCWLPIALPLGIWLQWRPGQPVSSQQKIPLLLSLYLLAPGLLWGSARLTGLPLSTYGLTWTGQSLVLGAIGWGLGCLGIGILVGLQLRFGWLIWQAQPGRQVLPTLVAIAGLGGFVALIEEWVFRGFLLTQLQQDYSWLGAAIGSSLIFALLHLVWDGLKIRLQLPGLWLMGMVLVLARWAMDGNLGLAWGLHAGWIGVLATLDSTGLIKPADGAPAWMTGIDGQPLAGAMSLLLLLGTATLIWGYRALG